jgi:hypothetical protein
MYDTEKKYIFTHPAKCAGASVEIALGIWNLDRDSEEFERYQRLLHESLSNHIKEIKSHGLNWRDFFIFSVVRNPWDRAVSRYFFLKTHHETYKSHNISFEGYIKQCYKFFLESGSHWHHSIKEFLYFEDEYVTDYVIRQENFGKGLQEAMQELGITDYETPHMNQNTVRPGNDYQSYYTTETKNMLKEIAADTIDLFAYKF